MNEIEPAMTTRLRGLQWRRRIAAFACACAVLGGFSGLAPWGLDVSNSSAQQMPASGNPMMQMANPASGSGRAGLRTWARRTFDGGQIAWLSVCAIGAMLLFPGGLLLYGRTTEAGAISRAVQVLPPIVALLTLLWVLVGYSLAFASNWGTASLSAHVLDGVDPLDIGRPVLGGLDHVGLAGLEPQAVDEALEYPLRQSTDQVPHMLFMFFQLSLAVTVAVPLTVLLSRRMHGGWLALVSCLWLLVVYVPAAHWIWGFGWLRGMGVLDFGGGAVRHLTLGFSALMAALLLHRREPSADPSAARSDIPFAAGAFLIWGGELFINGAGAWSASSAAVVALVNVQLAASAAACGWYGVEWLKRGSASGIDALSGALAGLAAISAASGYVAPQSALVIGLIAGVGCRAVSRWGSNRRGAEFMRVFSTHGVGGLLGMLLVGVFASANFSGNNRSGRSIDGLLSGNVELIGTQAIAALAIAGLAVVGSTILFLIVRTMGRIKDPASDQMSVPMHSGSEYPTS